MLRIQHIKDESFMIQIYHFFFQMIGVGTTDAELHNAGEIFCALLGRDRQSWGFSYKGYLQHDSKTQMYGATFNKDDLIGVHLDTWNGTLQFFLNQKPLGK
jgi:SPRY domain-containing SOCS box protein 3